MVWRLRTSETIVLGIPQTVLVLAEGKPKRLSTKLGSAVTGVSTVPGQATLVRATSSSLMVRYAAAAGCCRM